MVTAITMTYADEAIGVSRARRRGGLPVAISFTVETDGRLPSGQTLGEAIEQVDARDRRRARLLHDQLRAPDPLRGRARRATLDASGSAACAPTPRRKSHAELDEARSSTTGDPADLGARYAELQASLPQLNVLGGCCGTDHRHVAAICGAWLATG